MEISRLLLCECHKIELFLWIRNINAFRNLLLFSHMPQVQPNLIEII